MPLPRLVVWRPSGLRLPAATRERPEPVRRFPCHMARYYRPRRSPSVPWSTRFRSIPTRRTESPSIRRAACRRMACLEFRVDAVSTRLKTELRTAPATRSEGNFVKYFSIFCFTRMKRRLIFRSLRHNPAKSSPRRPAGETRYRQAAAGLGSGGPPAGTYCNL